MAPWPVGALSTSASPRRPAGTFTSVSAGEGHSCAIRTDSTLACWGNDDFAKAEPPAGTFTSVSPGDEHTCAVRTDGTLACWGDDSFGQAYAPHGRLHHGHPAPTTPARSRRTPRSPAGGTTQADRLAAAGPFRALSAGGIHTCGRRTNGAIACWGSDALGQSTPPADTFTGGAVDGGGVDGGGDDSPAGCGASAPSPAGA